VRNYLTISDLVRTTGEPPHRVRYALNTRGIVPVSNISGIRLWSRDQLSEIRAALQATAQHRCRRGLGVRGVCVPQGVK